MFGGGGGGETAVSNHLKVCLPPPPPPPPQKKNLNLAPQTCKVYNGYSATSKIEHGLSVCTVNNSLAKAHGLSLCTDGQPCSILRIIIINEWLISILHV